MLNFVIGELDTQKVCSKHADDRLEEVNTVPAQSMVD